MQFEEQHSQSLPLRLVEYGYEVNPLHQKRAAMEFSSFRNAIGTETTINITMSEACRRLTPLSRSYKAKATKIKLAWPMSWPRFRGERASRRPRFTGRRRCVPLDDQLTGDYPRPKKPIFEVST